MPPTLSMKLCISLLVALLAVAPPALGCTQCCRICGPLCPQVLYDNYFDEDCGYWDSGGGVSRNVVGGNALAELAGPGSVSQIWYPAEDNDLRFDFTVVPGSNPGTERVLVEIVDGTTILTTVTTLDHGDSNGTYTIPLGDYLAYQSSGLKIRFRMATLPSPGDTVYRIDNVYMWAY